MHEKPINKIHSELVLSINLKLKHPIMKKNVRSNTRSHISVSDCHHEETWEKFSCKLILLEKSILI